MRERKEIVQARPWLRKLLLIFDMVSLVGGFWLAQWTGFFIGLGLIVLGELFGPKTIEKITRDHWHSL